MADEVKIHLSTYLKDAGIKATKSQVEKLSRDVAKMNREVQSETERTERALGKLPGAFGKVQQAATGAFGKALAVVGAFKLGCDIGNWIFDKVITPLFKIKDPIEELKKENREIEQQWKAASDRFQESMAKWAAGWDKVVGAADKTRQKIEDVAAAYLKMQAARERSEAAAGDARNLAMERDKFDAMAGAFTPEEAAALGKYHDVLIAEEKSKQQLAKFDRDAEASAKRQAAAAEGMRAATEKLTALRREMAELDAKIANMDSNEATRKFGFNNTAELEKRLNDRKDALQAKIDAADRDVERRRSDVAAIKAGRESEAQERENLAARARLEVDERKKAYDDYVAHVEAEEAARAQDEWNRRQEEARREAEIELRERQRVERELAAQRIDDLRRELSERQRAESAAQGRQSAAQGALSTAWGWYRNQSQMQAVIDEQKAQAAAEVQWQKDFDRLKSFRRDWRTADFGSLSAADEAVRQVAFAKEEKAAADRAVIETAENTRDLADKLDSLLQMK